MLQAVKEGIVDYEFFVNRMRYLVAEKMGEGYDVQICKVLKNNSMELNSIVVLKQDKNIAPNIYLEPYYDSYLEGTAVEELAGRLCGIYRHSALPTLDEGFTYSLEDVKPFVFYRLVSRERNKKLLETVPHLFYLDLAITFHCLVRSDVEGIATIKITNEHMKLWEIELEDLKELAKLNTEELFPARIRKLEEVIGALLTGGAITEPHHTDVIYGDFGETNEMDGGGGLYVLTNQNGINGASCILYQNLIRKFARDMKSDIYILPSSIHEVILLPYDESLAISTLTNMVKEINLTQVPDEEVLSDRVYRYSRKENKIFI